MPNWRGKGWKNEIKGQKTWWYCIKKIIYIYIYLILYAKSKFIK